MKKTSKFTPKQISELQDLINHKESSKAEALRAQVVLMVNANIDKNQIKLLTGHDGKYAFKLRKRYLEKGLSELTNLVYCLHAGKDYKLLKSFMNQHLKHLVFKKSFGLQQY